jgi:hypothetical protein
MLLPTQVAVVPYPDDVMSPEDLMKVAAALQTQATRDLGPAWNVACVVTPFASVTAIPPGAIPLAIVRNGALGTRPHAFHVLQGRQPIALVERRENWSLLASHELMELLCDPWGFRVAPGTSLAEDQGEVEYLVEVCDPCQHSTYEINGVVVSDFVLPAFYGPPQADAKRCSFLGNIRASWQVLPGGALTWFSRVPREGIWQAVCSPKGELSIGPLDGTSDFSREAVNAHAAAGGPDVDLAAAVARRQDAASERFGNALAADIDALLHAPAAAGLTLEQTIEVLTMLVEDRDFYDAVSDPGRRAAALERLAKRGIDAAALRFPTRAFPSQQQYETVLRLLREFQTNRPGSRLDPPQLSSDQLDTAMHGYTG